MATSCCAVNTPLSSVITASTHLPTVAVPERVLNFVSAVTLTVIPAITHSPTLPSAGLTESTPRRRTCSLRTVICFARSEPSACFLAATSAQRPGAGSTDFMIRVVLSVSSVWPPMTQAWASEPTFSIAPVKRMSNPRSSAAAGAAGARTIAANARAATMTIRVRVILFGTIVVPPFIAISLLQAPPEPGGFPQPVT